MIERIILVDYENVQPAAEDLAGLDAQRHRLLIFHGPGQNSMPIRLANVLLPIGPSVEFIQCEKAGKDALDFHLSFHLGRLTVLHPQAEFIIVSRDRKGFAQLIEHGTRLGHRLLLTPSLREEGGDEETGTATRAPAAKKTPARKAPSRKTASKAAAGDAPAANEPPARAAASKRAAKVAPAAASVEPEATSAEAAAVPATGTASASARSPTRKAAARKSAASPAVAPASAPADDTKPTARRKATAAKGATKTARSTGQPAEVPSPAGVAPAPEPLASSPAASAPVPTPESARTGAGPGKPLRSEPSPADVSKVLGSLGRLTVDKRPGKAAKLLQHLRSHFRNELTEQGTEALLQALYAQGWISDGPGGKLHYAH